MDPLHPHLEAIKHLSTGGDEEQVAVLAAKESHSQSGLGHVNLFDLLARLVEHGHAVAAGEIDVALNIDGHAFRTAISRRGVCW